MTVTAIFVTSQDECGKTSICSEAENRFTRKSEAVRKEKKARTLIEHEGVRLSREDAADIQTIMNENPDEVGGPLLLTVR